MSWMEKAQKFLAADREMKKMHHPPSTGCLVEWRQETRVGCIQHLFEEYPHLVLLSITSRFVEPAFVQAIRQLDPERLELILDDEVEVGNKNFNVLRREGRALTYLTPEEMQYVRRNMPATVVVQPRGKPL